MTNKRIADNPLTIENVLNKITNKSADVFRLAKDLKIKLEEIDYKSTRRAVTIVVAEGKRHDEVLKILQTVQEERQKIAIIKTEFKRKLKKNYTTDAINGFMNYQSIDHTDRVEKLIERFEESYAGHFDSDTEFAEEMAEQCGLIDYQNLSWPHTCIDWEQAAKQLMWDYFKENGYYFRSDV